MHTLFGNIGHLMAIVSFVTAIVSMVAYLNAHNANELESKTWGRFAAVQFQIHFAAVIGVVIALFTIIYSHSYQYHYAWKHSSNNLPIYYMISCFWEGQEGSFLLWIFWHAVLAQVVLRVVSKEWLFPVMATMLAVQAFLASMILGLDIMGLKIGSSPFILLKDTMPDAPIFAQNPEFVPADGNGLNPLLQNYWMVIHPPTLFLGFAATLVPFAFAISGLWMNKTKEWIVPAMPWALFAAMILGTGIIMGGYWAYETLNFGGYWNWDPVENAVYVPWLVLIAGIHGMLLYKKNQSSVKLSLILVILTFLLILYSTFLTRSGILGESSVHSFTDLGLSGQLLIYLLAFCIVSIILLKKRWSSITETTSDAFSIYSKELWIVLGVLILCLSAFQIIFTTSIPVINKIISLVGLEGKMAPPVDQIKFYGDKQIWSGIAIAFIGGISQYVWWNNFSKKNSAQFLLRFFGVLLGCIIVSVVVIAYVHVDRGNMAIALQRIQEQAGFKSQFELVYTLLTFTLLLAGGIFALITSGSVFLKLWRSHKAHLGGGIAHIGVALMLIGILFSAGYSRVISLNKSGLLYSNEMPKDMNIENVLLWRNQVINMPPYKVSYKGPRIESRTINGYINPADIYPIDDDKVVAIRPITHKGDVQAKKGDTIQVLSENTYFEVEYTDDKQNSFTLHPRAQVNPSMGLLASPDVKHLPLMDLYTHVSSIPDPKEDRKWSDTAYYQVTQGDSMFLNDYVAVFDSARRVYQIDGEAIPSTDIAIAAYIRVMGPNKNIVLSPLLLIKDGTAVSRFDFSDDTGIRLLISKIDPATGTFTFAVNTTQIDYIILKVVEKPLINVLWIGTVITLLGLTIAMKRRIKEKI